MNKKQKSWIDKATYDQLLQRWRFAPISDPIYQAEIGIYYVNVMREKKEELSHDEQVSASKAVGWE